MNIIWHNGVFKDENEAVFTAADRIRLGDGVFDTMLAILGQEDGETSKRPHDNGTTPGTPPSSLFPRLIYADLHFSRILHNAKTLGLRVETLPDMEELKSITRKLLSKNGCEAGRYAVNTVISRGPGARGLAPPDDPQLQIVMRISAAPDEFPPVHAIIAQSVRRNEGSPLSRIKSCNYGDNILALREAQMRGANEAIMLNNAGHVACASTSNIVIVISGQLITPPLTDGAMEGVTRTVLMEKYDVLEQSFNTDTLKAADGIYLLNSLRGAVAVVGLEGADLPTPPLPIPQFFHLD